MIGHLYMVTISIVNIFQEVSFFSSTSFEHIQSPQSRSPQVGATSIKKDHLKLWMNRWIRRFKRNVCNSNIYMCVCVWESILILGFNMPILEVVKFHWPDNEHLSQWAWMPFLNHIWLGGVAHTTKLGWFYNGQYPHAWIFIFLVQHLMTFYKLHNDFEASFSIKNKTLNLKNKIKWRRRRRMGLAFIYSWDFKNFQADWNPRWRHNIAPQWLLFLRESMWGSRGQ